MLVAEVPGIAETSVLESAVLIYSTKAAGSIVMASLYSLVSIHGGSVVRVMFGIGSSHVQLFGFRCTVWLIADVKQVVVRIELA